MFVNDQYDYVTVCHGDDFLKRADASGRDAVDKVLSEKFDTKVLPRIWI